MKEVVALDSQIIKSATLDEAESFTSETNIGDNKDKGITECMERTDLDYEIIHCEDKLKRIDWEYNNSMTKNWPNVREKELFFIREIARLERLKKGKGPSTNNSIMLTDNIKPEEKRNGKVDKEYKN